jgi:hypothetical protein
MALSWGLADRGDWAIPLALTIASSQRLVRLAPALLSLRWSALPAALPAIDMVVIVEATTFTIFYRRKLP